VHSGFVAQEVEAAKKLEYDFDGVDKPENKEGLYGLRYENFIVPLVKAIQELSKQNEEKNAKIDDLQKQIDELKAMMTGSVKTGITWKDASLEQNIPNPFNNATIINYSLPQKFSNAQIIITDNAGKNLKQVSLTGSSKEGITVDAATLSAGAYYYSLIVDGKRIATKQMIHLR